MKNGLFSLVLLVSLGARAVAAPIVTLGPPVSDLFSTADPGSISIEMLGAGEIVELQLSITVHPFCIRPIDIGLETTGDGGTFTDQTGVVINGCGGDTSVFDIRVTGDGLKHTFDIEFLDVVTGVPLISIPAQLFPEAAPVVTLGPPVSDLFLTVDPGSARVELIGAGNFVDLQLSMTVHALCFVPIDVGLGTTGDGGTFTDLTGPLVNQCGGDISEFDIRLTGDGLARAYDIEFLDLNAGVAMASIPVELFPGAVDTDNDGISDISDNCIEAINADQRDTDADGIGNICDPDVAVPNDCAVNFLDLNVYRDNFFQSGDLDTDNNGDGQTNFADLNIVRSLFFAPPGPSGLPNACTQLSEGEVCDPGASLCGAGLSCCYPCGIPGCEFVCEVTCDPSDPGCVDGCFPRP